MTCNLGGLASGASATVTITVTPTAAGTVTNNASVTANESDPDPTNNAAAAVTTVNVGGISCLGTGSRALQGNVKTVNGKGLSGVTMTLSGPGSCSDTAMTSNKGHYRFNQLGNGTYTVTPAKVGCTFTPSSLTVTIAGSNAKANFVGTCP